MSIVKMSKVSLAGAVSERERIITRIMKLGLVEIVSYDDRNRGDGYDGLLRADGEDDAAAELEREMAGVGAAIDTVERYVPEKKPMFFSGVRMSKSDYKSLSKDFDKVKNLVGRINEINERLADYRSEENRLAACMESLKPWADLPIPLEETGTRTVKFIVGTVPVEADTDKITAEAGFDKIADALSQAAPESCIEQIGGDALTRRLFVMAHRDCEEAALGALQRFGFTRAIFKDVTGTAKENIEAARARIAEIVNSRNEYERLIIKFASQKIRLQAYYDHLEIRAARKRIVSRLGRTDDAFYLEGWIPSKNIPALAMAVSGEADCIIEISEPYVGESYPILLDNPKVAKPFEAITAMYSLPSVGDIDPTRLMTPFFIVFFGIMVGDFAYGVIIAAFLGAVLYKLKPAGTAGNIIKVLFLGGVSAAVWGAVFGSCFGNLPQALAGWIAGDDYGGGFYGLWFDPMADPMRMLLFSMLLGALHLAVGMGVKMYSLLRSGKIFDAVFDVGSWYILLIGLPLMILNIFPGMYMTIAGAAMIVLTNGRSAKNPVTRLLGGLLSLYGATGYLGDVLSYSRLLALGMATGAIAAVVNTMATLGAPGIVSSIACFALVAFGTAFNIAISALGAFVHTARLQYIEFFGKFYEGGGDRFEPFAIKTKYIKVI